MTEMDGEVVCMQVVVTEVWSRSVLCIPRDLFMLPRYGKMWFGLELFSESLPLPAREMTSDDILVLLRGLFIAAATR